MLELNNFLRSPFLDMPSISFNNKNLQDLLKNVSETMETYPSSVTSYLTTETDSGIKVVVLAPGVQENGSKTIELDFKNDEIVVRYKVVDDAKSFFITGYNTIKINIDSVNNFKLKQNSFKARNGIITFELESIKETKNTYTF
ncbi:TPA: hypothetical protein SG275_001360 [Campylobacter coli]|nr:hypothetical protein [Campylobacter coli]